MWIVYVPNIIYKNAILILYINNLHQYSYSLNLSLLSLYYSYLVMYIQPKSKNHEIYNYVTGHDDI